MLKEKLSLMPSDQKVEKSETYLRGILNGGEKPLRISQAALELAISAHGETRRNDGTLYISHPIAMACLAIGLGIRNDELIATTLLHDVCEDCGVLVQNVSKSPTVRQAVRLMTVEAKDYDSTKADVKRRYFYNLLDSPEALICKALDRIHNLVTSVGVFERERALKNWRETYHLLLKVTEDAKRKWPEWSDTLHILRFMLKNNLSTMADKFEFTEEEMCAEYGTFSFEKKAPELKSGELAALSSSIIE